ncbi:MAG: type II toxin-antitoxin system RelE/ParE family toxin [Chloroflexi bacterium]|nr:type II toxin-antitoxin system RelE/ParE family toxin [Chloroflexota bacterium]
MSKPFHIETEAAAEFEQAAVWYESRRSGLGQELLAAVDDCLDFIAQGPGPGSLAPGVPSALPVRRAPVRRYPYRVVYLETDAANRILAFAHDRMRPGYWRSRM